MTTEVLRSISFMNRQIDTRDDDPVEPAWWFTACSRMLWRLPFRGRLRLARALIRLTSRRTNVRMTIPGGIRLVLPGLDEPLAQMLIAYGCYEPESLRVIIDHLPQSGTFVDVGANVGLMTAQVSRLLAPNGNVLAIEASPKIFSRLEQAISDNNLANVKAIHAAVTDHSQTDIPFYNAPEANFGMGSLAPQFDAEPILVPARSLDDILAEQNVTRVDVMKVDVEGFEAGVFLGAKKLLTGSHPPHIVFECLDWAERRANIPMGESQRILLDFGYTLHRMNGEVLREPLTTGGDNLWAQPPAAHL